MKTSKRNLGNVDELKLARMREIWPLRMVIELSQKILDKGVIKGNEVIFSAEDRKKLLFYSSKIEPMFTQIKQTPRTDIEPLERVIDDLREKIYHFGKNGDTRSHGPLS
jgi:hypothetical protein